MTGPRRGPPGFRIPPAVAIGYAALVPAPTTQPAQPTQRVTARPLDPTLERDLLIVRRLAKAMDGQFEVAGFRFGWDAIIGLAPVVGDVATTVVALYPLYLARKHKLGAWTLAKMLKNVGLDFAVGFVPLVGDVADAAFKANVRNLKLFEDAVAGRRGGNR